MKIVFGNLKMNFLFSDFLSYVDKLNTKLMEESPKVKLGIAVPYIYLERAASLLSTDITVLAQDLHHSSSGAFTSSISPPQLSSINVHVTLVGHSECRALNQNAFVVEQKVRSALEHKFLVVYCCGADPLEEIGKELGSLTEEDMNNVIIAYEPIASIGTGKALDDSSAAEELDKIRDFISEHWSPELAKNIKLLYGGSVNLSNYKSYLQHDSIDGVLVGGASLKVEDLWSMATLK